MVVLVNISIKHFLTYINIYQGLSIDNSLFTQVFMKNVEDRGFAANIVPLTDRIKVQCQPILPITRVFIFTLRMTTI